MGRFIKPVTEQSGFDTAMQQRDLPAQAGPKGLAAPESSASSPSDNRPLNALPAVTIPANDAAMEELEQPLLPKTTPDRAERILNDAALAAAAGAASAMIAGGADTTIPDVEVLPLDQSPLHVQGEEGASAAAADPFADIYQDFKQRELSPESTGAYVPLKGNDTASPVRLGGYGTAPSPLTARGITRPPVHERGDLDPLYSATAYELLPQDRNQGDAIVNQFDHLLGTQTEQQQQPSAAAGAIILGDVPETAVVAPTLLEDMQLIEAPSAIASGTTAQSAAGTTKQPYLRRGAGLTAAAAKTQPTMSRRLQRGRSYDPFAAVDAALAELGHDSGKQQRALVRTQKTSLEVSDRPLRHWGSEVAVVLQPDIDQAPNFKKSFARTHSKVNRKQRCFLSTAQREANTIEMPDFTVSTPAPNAPGTQPVKRNSFRANRMLAPENDAMRGIDELLLNKKPLRHWGYEPAIVCQPDIDQAPNYKKRFTLRRPKNTIGAHRSSFRGSHRGGVVWFIPFAGGCLRTKGGLAWAIDTGAAAQTDAGEQPQITQALVVYDGPTDGDAIPLPAQQNERASYDARPQSLAAASAKTEDGSVEEEEPRYWKRTDSTVTSNSLNGTATGDDDSSSGKKKHKSGLKKLASKLIHGFHKSKKNKHAEDGDGNNNTLPPTTVFNAPRTVRTAAYPLGLPVAPVVEKKRMKELKKHGIAVPVAVAGDQRADPAFSGPQRVTCAEQPTTPVPIATLSPSAIHNGNIGPAFVAPPTESPATAAIAADPAVLAVGPKAVNTADAEEHRVSAFSG